MKDWNNKQPPGRPEACSFINKETLAQVFSSEFDEISKNTFFIEHLWWLLFWNKAGRKNYNKV